MNFNLLALANSPCCCEMAALTGHGAAGLNGNGAIACICVLLPIDWPALRALTTVPFSSRLQISAKRLTAPDIFTPLMKPSDETLNRYSAWKRPVSFRVITPCGSAAARRFGGTRPCTAHVLLN